MCSGISSLGSATRPSGNSGKSRTSGTPEILRWSGIARRIRAMHHRDRLVPARPARPRPPLADRRGPLGRPRRARVRARRRPAAAAAAAAAAGQLHARLPARAARGAARARRRPGHPRAAGRSGSWWSWRGRRARAALHFASDVSPFAMARDRRVEARARPASSWCAIPGNFVADVGKPRTKDGKPFSVFSPFHRAWERLPRREIHGAPRSLALPSGVAVGQIPRARERASARPDGAGREGRRARGCTRGSATGSTATPTATTGSRAAPPSSRPTCTSAASPRASWRRGRERGGEGPAEFVRQLAGATSTPTCCCNNPRNARHAHQAEMDDARVGGRRRGLRGVVRGPHRLPGGRRRDAPARAPAAGCTTARG